MKTITLILLILMSAALFAQEKESFSISDKDANSLFSKHDTINERKRYRREFKEFWICGRVNYLQGKYGYLGIAIPFTWNDINDAPPSHIGFSMGVDLRLSKTIVYAPKFVVEAEICPGILRAGYQYYTESGMRSDHRILAEVGLSIYLIDITYLHTFSLSGDPFKLGNDYLSVTCTFPIHRFQQ